MWQGISKGPVASEKCAYDITLLMLTAHERRNVSNKQRVLMHGHQGWNVWHGLCHICMRYVFTWVVYSFCLFCCLFINVTWWYVWCIVCASGNQESTGMFYNLMPIYYIMLQFILNQATDSGVVQECCEKCTRKCDKNCVISIYTNVKFEILVFISVENIVVQPNGLLYILSYMKWSWENKPLKGRMLYLSPTCELGTYV